MSDDLQDKTEEATPKKLADARKKGQVAKSQDLTASFMLFIALGGLLFFGSYIYQMLESFTVAVFLHLGEDFSSLEAVGYWFRQGMLHQVMMLLPFLLIILVGAVLVNVYQVGFEISFEPLEPKWNKVNLFDVSLYKKLVNLQALMRLVFGLSKMLVVGIISFLIIQALEQDMQRLIYANVNELFVFIFSNSFYIGIVTAIILITLGVFDFVYQKWKFSEDMKMSQKEVKDERKQSEGDAHVRGKMRGMMQSFMQSRMKDQVPKADVVIANPTHYAIAVMYHADKLAAPLCLAKGMRKRALDIKELATEHNVPIVENPPLARALYKVVEPGSYVPPDFYKPVAEVLAHVYRMDEKLKQKAGVE